MALVITYKFFFKLIVDIPYSMPRTTIHPCDIDIYTSTVYSYTIVSCDSVKYYETEIQITCLEI